MDQNKNMSFSLLSQEEIDTLIRFLTDKKNTVNNDIMSQESIDKLIRLIATDGEHLVLNPFVSLGNINPTFLENINFRKNADELCELRYSVNSENNYLELFVDNKESGETLQITPRSFNDNDSEYWGYAITPARFVQTAYALSVNFSQDTYDSIYQLYAKINFGAENYNLPEIYLPDNSILVACIL